MDFGGDARVRDRSESRRKGRFPRVNSKEHLKLRRRLRDRGTTVGDNFVQKEETDGWEKTEGGEGPKEKAHRDRN